MTEISPRIHNNQTEETESSLLSLKRKFSTNEDIESEQPASILTTNPPASSSSPHTLPGTASAPSLPTVDDAGNSYCSTEALDATGRKRNVNLTSPAATSTSIGEVKAGASKVAEAGEKPAQPTQDVNPTTWAKVKLPQRCSHGAAQVDNKHVTLSPITLKLL